MPSTFTDDEKARLKEILKTKHPELDDDKLSQKVDEYILQKPDEARAELNQASSDDKDILTVDDQPPEQTPEDDSWKDKVREAINSANSSLGYKFKEDTKNTKYLTFKDHQENTIAFSSPDNAYIEGSQIAFDELVVAAKKIGKDTINFGKFEDHPEYKAMLYLACLRHGIKMKKAPELSELAAIDHHQAKEAFKGIIRHYYHEAEDDLNKAKDTFYTAINNPKNKDEQKLQALVNSLQAEKDDNKKKEIREKINATPLGQKLENAINKRAQLLQKGLAAGILNRENLNVRKNKIQKSASTNADKKQKINANVEISVISRVLSQNTH